MAERLKAWKNLLHSQEGALGMILVIGFMALAVPLVTSSLFMSSAISRDSQVKNDIMKRQYAALGVGGPQNNRVKIMS